MIDKKQIAEAVRFYKEWKDGEVRATSDVVLNRDILLALAQRYLDGEIGEYASEEEIANKTLFWLESGQWHLVSTLVNSGDVVGLAKALVNKVAKKELEDK